ncbi:MAG: hypothetical protein QNK11_05890 [Legionella sp.]|nr:hypothetical protein [Legionella sp.]
MQEYNSNSRTENTPNKKDSSSKTKTTNYIPPQLTNLVKATIESGAESSQETSLNQGSQS